MKVTLFAMSIALLLAGCGEEAKKKAVVVDKWAEWEANPTPYGGLKVLAKIKEAKESGATELELRYNWIYDVSPLKGLTNLKKLDLSYNNIGADGAGMSDESGYSPEIITDLSPLAGLTNLKALWLWENEITDVSPLAGLTNLETLVLHNNKISDLSPLKGLTKLEKLYLRFNPISDAQKAMLKKALPNCGISFSPSTASVQVAPASESINSSSGE